VCRFPDRVHLEVVIRDDRVGMLATVEVDIRPGAFEVVALADFLTP
jgi:hypothetical protein